MQIVFPTFDTWKLPLAQVGGNAEQMQASGLWPCVHSASSLAGCADSSAGVDRNVHAVKVGQKTCLPQLKVCCAQARVLAEENCRLQQAQTQSTSLVQQLQGELNQWRIHAQDCASENQNLKRRLASCEVRPAP